MVNGTIEKTSVFLGETASRLKSRKLEAERAGCSVCTASAQRRVPTPYVGAAGRTAKEFASSHMAASLHEQFIYT
jgi:hypothetical protein